MLFMLPIMFVLYSNMNNIDVRSSLLEYSIRVLRYKNIIGLFNSTYAFQCILNVLLERIELLNTVQCIFICTNYSIREFRSDFSQLC